MTHISNLWISNIQTNHKNRHECCGCSACASICSKSAIKLRFDNEMFLYPVIDESRCVECGLCLRVCPITNKCESAEPYLKTYAGYSLNNEIMRSSTSGGFVTTISRMVIQNGGVVYAVKYDESFTRTIYSVAKTISDLTEFAGSKYIQSDKGDIFRQVRAALDLQQEVLFVGCPCDVAALKRYLLRDYDNLITCELVCMGVTSSKIAIDYKQWSEKKNHSNIVSINMRSKSRGWFVPHLEEHFKNGRTKCKTLFGTYLGYGFQIFNRPSCFVCQFRDTVGVGDIRVGDFWGIKDTDEYWNPDGVSGIYIRTQKGLDIISRIEQNEFKVFETSYLVATRNNMSSYMNKPQKYQRLRDKFARIYIDEAKGLPAACRSVATLSFWVKRLVPDTFHGTIKKIFHLIKDVNFS